ncbi:hypothetical protein ACFV14_37525 [Streptomyces zaomyceticus]|uniref:hypothetical protein n=1 Tax=Streptomyces zaomyceticus TaxID=68286 RepID=UPI0036B31F9D
MAVANSTDGPLSSAARAERKRTSDRIAARMRAPQFSLRARRSGPPFGVWRHDLRETRATWFRLVDSDGQDPTPEGS